MSSSAAVRRQAAAWWAWFGAQRTGRAAGHTDRPEHSRRPRRGGEWRPLRHRCLCRRRHRRRLRRRRRRCPRRGPRRPDRRRQFRRPQGQRDGSLRHQGPGPQPEHGRGARYGRERGPVRQQHRRRRRVRRCLGTGGEQRLGGRVGLSRCRLRRHRDQVGELRTAHTRRARPWRTLRRRLPALTPASRRTDVRSLDHYGLARSVRPGSGELRGPQAGLAAYETDVAPTLRHLVGQE